MTVPAAKSVTVAGLDPGPKPGAVVLTITPDPKHGDAVLTAEARTVTELEELYAADYLAVERYELQPRSGKRQDKRAQTTTMVMAEEAFTQGVARLGRDHVQFMGPGAVKPWATDRRLERYGLAVKGGHHQDALRHALHYAVRLGLLPRL